MPDMSLIKKMLAPIARRVGNMVVRGLVELVDDGQTLQSLQVSLQSDIVNDKVERFQQYGFSSYPKKSAELIALRVGGDPDHLVVIAVDDRASRPTGQQEGEVVLFTAQNGIRVLLKQDGTVNLGTTPSDFVALAQKVLTELTNLANNVNTNYNAIVAAMLTGATSTGPVTFSSPFVPTSAATPNSVAAAEVKAK